jgi:hypothetical protein
MPSLADLIRMGKQYVTDALPGGSLNPETQPVADQARYIGGITDPDNSQIGRDLQAWHKRTQAGLADQLAGKQTPEAEYAYQSMMQAAGVAPVGMIAWHGSPHKFDKFSLDKIGTGEGAQAYGHGLYLAEAPGVAQEYAKMTVPGPEGTAQMLLRMYKDRAVAKDVAEAGIKPYLTPEAKAHQQKVVELLAGDVPIHGSNLYKTDIPDEAVARFLDWDKPLSQQAPEVQAAINRMGVGERALFGNQQPNIYGEPRTVAQAYNELSRGGADGAAKANASAVLQQAGIPGIRYLDGGSRSAGQGSSNFVAFDPEMIRILERNGVATGAKPWAPGEYGLKDLIPK